jgi:hypothetical protein
MLGVMLRGDVTPVGSTPIRPCRRVRRRSRVMRWPSRCVDRCWPSTAQARRSEHPTCPRMDHARGSRPSSVARGLRCSQVLVRLPQDRDVELLLGDQPLEPSVLDLELLQPLRLLRLHAAVPVASAVEGLLAHAEVLQHLRHRAARREHGVGLAELVDHLLRCVSCPFHRESRGLPRPSRGRSGLAWRMDQFSGAGHDESDPPSIRGIHVGNPPHAGPTSRSQIGLGEWLVIGIDGRFLDAFHAQLQFHRSVKQPIE